MVSFLSRLGLAEKELTACLKASVWPWQTSQALICSYFRVNIDMPETLGLSTEHADHRHCLCFEKHLRLCDVQWLISSYCLSVLCWVSIFIFILFHYFSMYSLALLCADLGYIFIYIWRVLSFFDLRNHGINMSGLDYCLACFCVTFFIISSSSVIFIASSQTVKGRVIIYAHFLMGQKCQKRSKYLK